MNEFVADLAKVLELPLDTAVIIKGAAGEKGQKGDKGAKGDQGPPGDTKTLVQYSIAIPNGVSFVEFAYFPAWKNATYSIIFDGYFNGVGVEEFDPADGIVGVGTVVPVLSVPTPTTLRCYFTFAGGITATPNSRFKLQISILQ